MTLANFVQCVAVCCSVDENILPQMLCSKQSSILRIRNDCCECGAVCCSALQCVAVWCSV